MIRDRRGLRAALAVPRFLTSVSRGFGTNHTPAATDVVIVAAVRTPIGSMGGALKAMPGTALGSAAVKAAVERAGISPSDVGEVLLGNVLPANSGQAPSRQVALGAGLPESVPTTDINKVCASGMKSVMLGAQSISLGNEQVVVAGGFESMSNVPFYLPKGVPAYGHTQLLDGLLKDGLWDVYNDVHMGTCGEKCAEDYDIGREEQDAWAARSYERAVQAQQKNLFDAELVALEVPQGRGRDPVVVTVDEEPGRYQGHEKLQKLRAAFSKQGTITAANASKLNDGASALVLMSREKADSIGATPLATILGAADGAQAPMDFTTAPAMTVPKALLRAGLWDGDDSTLQKAVDAIDLHEINEAFSVVALANSKILNLDADKVNVRGGAVALGHPIGASGARIVTTLVHALRDEVGVGAIGVASICNGGGGASAIVLRAE